MHLSLSLFLCVLACENIINLKCIKSFLVSKLATDVLRVYNYADEKEEACGGKSDEVEKEGSHRGVRQEKTKT